MSDTRHHDTGLVKTSLVQPYVHYYYILNSIDTDNKGVHDEVIEIFKDCINFYSPPPNLRHLG